MTTPNPGPIEPGRMVMIVRCCCVGTQRGIGKTFTVSYLETQELTHCIHCERHPVTRYAYFADPRGGITRAPLPWLMRIDPPEEMKCEEKTNSIPAIDRTTPAAPTRSPELVS